VASHGLRERQVRASGAWRGAPDAGPAGRVLAGTRNRGYSVKFTGKNRGSRTWGGGRRACARSTSAFVRNGAQRFRERGTPRILRLVRMKARPSSSVRGNTTERVHL
jgi:predicted NAD/FAD-dependent oxidoreductase